MNILEALEDPKLFSPHFKGSSWAAWYAFLAALFGLPMSDEALATYQSCTGRTAAPAKAFREAVLIVGRRGGKSRVLALIAVFLACFRDYRPALAPGEMATLAVIAADRRQARVIFRYIVGMLKAVGLLASLIEDEGAESITLKNQVVIEIATASFRVTRGYTFAAVLADECAFWRDSETSANPDTEIIRALQPGLSSIPGSLLLIASSPYRKAGVLWNQYRRHYGRDDARVLVWKADTLTMNPSLNPAIIEEAYQDDPQSAAAEYGGSFRDDIDDFVSREVVEACTVPGRLEVPPVVGKQYHAFVDPSGGSADSMALAIAHAEDNVAKLDAVREVRPPFSPESVVIEFAELLKSYGLARVTGDRYAGEWPRERFRTHGIQYDLAEHPKSVIYGSLLPLLNSKRVQLLDLPRLQAQLCQLERRTSRSGRDSIDHPAGPGSRDDVSNAAGGALVAAVGTASGYDIGALGEGLGAFLEEGQYSAW